MSDEMDTFTDIDTDDGWGGDTDTDTDTDTGDGWGGDVDTGWGGDADPDLSWTASTDDGDASVTASGDPATGSASVDVRFGETCLDATYDTNFHADPGTGEVGWTGGDDGDGVESGFSIGPCD